ncbi:MAG: rod shape-determining protein [Acidimicrobiia bacterium]|nr:rod shape-determining protein [Acidimicrobiia bacterium]MYC58111.1 rod shape-determining protein [Acidimicrobiia bacterium]MYG94399.1 rod shape-determining protein [Acidimicrobiia bacterium]MYI30543.1 rod shape-determining protein [Acidimicrobiia bacterium]
MVKRRLGSSSRLVGRDVAIDLGTANTLVYVRGEGILINEPSVVTVNSQGMALAVGSDAKQMLGRTPSHIQAIRPLRDGVIANFDICEKMLRYFIQKVSPGKFIRPRMVICVPSGITPVEQRAVQEAAVSAGAKKPVYIIEEPMAAAIGAGLPVQEASGSMIVDIGGGTTEVAMISLGGVVAGQSVRMGGDRMDEDIIAYLKKEHSLTIGSRTAEEVKMVLGTAWAGSEERRAEVRGQDLVTGLPKTVITSSFEIGEAIAEVVRSIVDAVKATLDETPPELAADIMQAGIVLAGGGALLDGLIPRIEEDTGMPVRLAPQPLHAVAIGSGQSLEEFGALEELFVSSSYD